MTKQSKRPSRQFRVFQVFSDRSSFFFLWLIKLLQIMDELIAFPGIESLSMDMKDKKLTVVGEVDPVAVVGKLKKKKLHTELLTVGPAKGPEKKPEPKKEEPKKEEPKKDGDKKKEAEQIAELVKAYQAYNPWCKYYRVMSVEENPNACVIS